MKKLKNPLFVSLCHYVAFAPIILGGLYFTMPNGSTPTLGNAIAGICFVSLLIANVIRLAKVESSARYSQQIESVAQAFREHRFQFVRR